MKILTIHSNPVLDVIKSDTTDKSSPNYRREYGVNRDRDPDNGWSESRQTCMTYSKEAELTPDLKIKLLEDLAFVYGRNSKMFSQKLKEFNLL